MTSWFKARFGRMRVSTLVLLAVFCALFWVYQTFEPEPAPPPMPPTAVVPPGFVPDPNYTWVPRTNVRPPIEEMTTTETTTPPPTTTTSPTETTPASPEETTSPTEATPEAPAPPQTPTTAPTGPTPTPAPAS